MVLYTYIARTDGTPLSASTDEITQDLSEQKRQIKVVIGRLTPSSEPMASIESGNYTISYLLDNEIVYMCITERSYPRKLVFSYLEEIKKEFSKSYGTEALKPNVRPYAFAKFDGFMLKTRGLYQDARASQNLDKLNAELQDVTKVMTKNIEDLLYRGDSLDRMSDLSSNLKEESKKYRRAAQRVNLEAMFRQYAPIVGIAFILLFIIWWRFF